MIVVVSYSRIFTRNSMAANCILWMLRIVISLTSVQVVMASVVEDKMERSIYLTPFSATALEEVLGESIMQQFLARHGQLHLP